MTGKQFKVLVVDDEPAIREMIRFALGKGRLRSRAIASSKAAPSYKNLQH